MELEARYVIEASGGELIYVDNRGLRHGPAEVVEKLMRGEPVDPTLVYFRAAPCFETEAAAFKWMTRSLFVCAGTRLPTEVLLSVYEVT